MASPVRNSVLFDLLLLINRVALGLLFVLAGVRKLIPASEGTNIVAQLGAFATNVAKQAPLPEILGRLYGYALPFVEMIAGALLVLGLFSRSASGLITLMLLSFMIAMGLNWWPPAGSPFEKNLILFTLAALLTVTGSGRIGVDGLRAGSRRARH